MPYAAAMQSEMEQYRVYEGSFFGNIFTENGGTKYVCQGEPTHLAIQQSSDRQWRRCTDPNYDCGFTNLGKCSNVCSDFNANYGYSVCRGSDNVTYPAVNVFLKSNSGQF